MNWTGSPGIQDAFTYLPWTAVLLAPGRWLFGDVRWALAFWTLVAVAGVWLLARGAATRHTERSWVWTAAAVTACSSSPRAPSPSSTRPGPNRCCSPGWSWWAVLVQRDRAWWAVIPLALACASKQHLALLLPVLLLWRPFGWRRSVATGALDRRAHRPVVPREPAGLRPRHDQPARRVPPHQVRQHALPVGAQHLWRDAAVRRDRGRGARHPRRPSAGRSGAASRPWPTCCAGSRWCCWSPTWSTSRPSTTSSGWSGPLVVASLALAPRPRTRWCARPAGRAHQRSGLSCASVSRPWRTSPGRRTVGPQRVHLGRLDRVRVGVGARRAGATAGHQLGAGLGVAVRQAERVPGLVGHDPQRRVGVGLVVVHEDVAAAVAVAVVVRATGSVPS